MNKKHKVSLVIGRFQPFHLGHLFLIKEALKISDKVIIGIGSSNVKNSDNLFSFEERKKMIESVFIHEKIGDRLINIIALEDIPDDDLWLKNVLLKVQSFSVVIGNNNWVNSIFKNGGFIIHEIPYYKRYLYEGEKIRGLMREGKKWQDRIPKYLVSSIEFPSA